MAERSREEQVLSRKEALGILAKAAAAARVYRTATGVGCVVLDGEGYTVETEAAKAAAVGSAGGLKALGCAVCAVPRGAEADDGPYPCRDVHLHAAAQARRFGGTFVYLCSIGFMHWVGPLVAGGRTAGVLVGGPVLSIDREDAVDSILKARGAGMDRATAEACVDRIPRADPERVQALAELLTVTAEQVSRTPLEDYAGPKRRTEQQSRISEEIHTMKSRMAAGINIHDSPLDKERRLLEALRRGDNDTGRKLLNELLGLIFFSDTSRFDQVRFRAVELAVLLFRAAMESGGADGEGVDAGYRYLRRIEEAKDAEELADILNIVVERLSRRIFIFSGVKHAATLRKAERYIRDHYTRKIGIAEVAAAAGLSPAYFSTIFKDEMGESFSDYLGRLRTEQAARLLVSTERSLADIAGECGFEDQSWFSKTFKRYMGSSPGRYRESGGAPANEAEEHHEA